MWDCSRLSRLSNNGRKFSMAMWRMFKMSRKVLFPKFLEIRAYGHKLSSCWCWHRIKFMNGSFKIFAFLSLYAEMCLCISVFRPVDSYTREHSFAFIQVRGSVPGTLGTRWEHTLDESSTGYHTHTHTQNCTCIHWGDSSAAAEDLPSLRTNYLQASNTGVN